MAAVAQFTPWTTPLKVEGLVNTDAPETCVAVSKNGLSLYYARFSLATGYDLYVSQRATVDEPWGMATLLWSVSSNFHDFCPALSLDEHRLYLASFRPGGCGDGFTDIYVSRRHDRRDDYGWEQPENLGCELNSPRSDQAPSFFEDDTGAMVMYFASNRVPPRLTLVLQLKPWFFLRALMLWPTADTEAREHCKG